MINYRADHVYVEARGVKLFAAVLLSAEVNAHHYVRHTNEKGLCSARTTAKAATNTVLLGEPFLTLPVEE